MVDSDFRQIHWKVTEIGRPDLGTFIGIFSGLCFLPSSDFIPLRRPFPNEHTRQYSTNEQKRNDRPAQVEWWQTRIVG